MKKVILYQNFYIDKHSGRQEELEECLNQNIACAMIDEIVLVINEPGLMQYVEDKFICSKITIAILKNRPTYNDFLMLFKDEHAIHILANTDVYLNGTLALVKTGGVQDKKCFALSRYDRMPDGSLSPHLCRGSQDVWIFGKPPKVVPGADFTLGIPGCDNKFAHLLRQIGFMVTNPSRDIHITHIHNTGIRNYLKDKDRLPPPYFLVYPIHLREA